LGAKGDETQVKSGKVYLVGAGPGDPGLMTVKGLDCLRRADVVIYDRLIEESILHEARPEAEKIYVGKASSHHTLEQETINRLLIRKAREGKVVVRLKGGDPFVLGRGGEEAEALAENHIPFEVVPGVSSAVAVPAYAGIPVTHREVASSFTVVTGHKASDRGEPNIAWDKLATGTDTLVILMGIGNLAYVVDQLIKNNKPPSTPVAVITHGTTGRQRSVTGTLRDIVAKVKSEDLKPPSVVVVGDVVHLRKHLRWFDK
jgi:uroporphyrin-III C-methyltransferase